MIVLVSVITPLPFGEGLIEGHLLNYPPWITQACILALEEILDRKVTIGGIFPKLCA